VILGVEVREEKAFVFTDTLRGEGGLPVGTQPKLICLLKGDVNSALACWLTMKRGCQPVFLHFDNTPFVESNSLDSVLNHAQTLSEWMSGFPKRLKVVSNSQNLAEIIDKCPRDFADLLCKRLMFRIAEQIADTERAEGIVSGETLGDKNGLTPHNFRLEDEAVKNYPLHRPLLGLATHEIEQLTQRLKILETSALRKTKKKTVSKKRKQVSKASLEDIKRAEEKLNIDEFVKRSMKTIKNA
jgi:thiamine biosynthesis protein ThiI